MIGLLSGWKLAAVGIGALVLLAMLGTAIAVIEKHGEAKGSAATTAILQPKLDQANIDVGTLTAAAATNEAYIRALQANEQANDILNDQLADRVAALTQQSAAADAAIRKLENDDKDVAAFLRTPIPDALRSLLNNRPAGGGSPAAGGGGQGSAAAAAKGRAL